MDGYRKGGGCLRHSKSRIPVGMSASSKEAEVTSH